MEPSITTTSTATQDFVKTLTNPTEKFLCPLVDNKYIKFGSFRIRDMISGLTLVDVNESDIDNDIKPEEDDPSIRVMKYHFGPDFLRLKTVGLQVEFHIQDISLPSLTLIERHYFKGKVMKSFEFKFGFCIPSTTNTIEMIYDMPELTDEEREDMIQSPWETKSDTFFFVEDKLIVHNRAEYSYSPFV